MWRITTNPSMDDERFAASLLTFAAAALKPPQPFACIVQRLSEDELVTEVVAAEHLGADAKRFGEVGDAVPLAAAPQRRAVRTQRVMSWEDSADDFELNGLAVVRSTGLRSLIVVPFTAGQMTYTLSFVSATPAETPFDGDDHAFAEIIAAQMERRLQQKWQAVKIRSSIENVNLSRGVRQNVIPLHASHYARRATS